MGERQQGTLEPLLTTPIRSDELLLGKAVATLAASSIWIAILISTRADDVRVAQQLATLASLPAIAVTTLVAFNIIDPSLRTAVLAGGARLTLDALGWRRRRLTGNG